MRFLFVRSGFCPSRISILPRDIRLPSDSTSRWTPLPSAGVSHCQARNGLSPSSCHPCRVHLLKSPAEIVLPAVDQLIDRYFAELLRYYDDMAEDYHKHLVKLIGEKTREKETVSSHLSDDEKRLQEDNDWLSEVKDQLQNIERG